MQLHSQWSDPDTSVRYNDIWGYVDSLGREYAIIGSSYGTNFLDVTNPTAPRLIASIAGRDTRSVWRDFKTYGHYAYGVADGGAHSLQIFDLQYLPDSVRLVYDEDSLSYSCHTCFIEGDRLYLVANEWLNHNGQSGDDAVVMLSLANPEVPTWIHSFSQTITPGRYGAHAAYARRDTLYLSGADDGLFIYDLRQATVPRLIKRISNYAGHGYNHSSWTTTNGHLAVVADEVPLGLPLKLFDLTHVRQPRLITSFNSTPLSTPHNPYIVQDRYVVASHYLDGVQVWDIANPAQPLHIGGFDTRPENDSSATGYNTFAGCWGVYPFLPSGTLIASDIERGLFVLQPPYTVLGTPKQPETSGTSALTAWPNPIRTGELLRVAAPATGEVQRADLFDALGRRVRPAQLLTGADRSIVTTGLAPGMYGLRLTGSQTRVVRIIVEAP